MYKFIQKNQKKFLAIFGVLLMIVFILPTSFKNSNLGRGDLTIGTVDGEKITGNELGLAKNDLEYLREREFLPLFELGNGPDPRSGANVYGKYFRGDDGALAYLLLQKEAEKQGFSVSTQAAEALVASAFKGVQFTQDQLDQLTPAVARFMLVQGAFERASESVKVSMPVVQYYMAQDYQGSKLNLVEYSAAEMEKSVPVPTPEQIAKQYEQYGDRYPGTSFLTTQPATPGYKVPDRVKLQYLELPHQAVVESVLNELSPDELYRFDRDTGYPYYEKHQSEFPIPATRPVFGPVLPSPTTKPFGEVAVEIRKRLLTDATLSATDQAVDLRARVAAREKQLRTALHDELDRAYADWAAAPSTGSTGSTDSTSSPQASSPQASSQQAGLPQAGSGPGQAPAATQPVLPTTNPLAAAYPDLDFLTAFANKFEAQYKVRPLVNSLANRWLTDDDLRSIPDLASANAGETPFAEYAMHDLTPPATQPSTTNPATTPTTAATAATAPTTSPAADVSVTSWHPIGTGLRPFEPSELLQDPSGNAFVFRLTAFEPAHRPPLADVEQEIVTQLKLSAGYQLAHEQAVKLLNNAQVEARLRKEQNMADLQGLPAAAKAAGKPLIQAGPFRPRTLQPMQSLPGYEIADLGDKFMFTKAVEDLAKVQTPTNLHPSTLIELPGERKVVVAEMGDTILIMPAGEIYVANQVLAPMARNAMETGKFTQEPTPGTDLLAEWFDLKNVIARVKYVKNKGA